MINSDSFDSGGRKQIQEDSPAATNVQDRGAIAKKLYERFLNTANDFFTAAELV